MQKQSNRVVSAVITGLLLFESVVLGAAGQGSAAASPTAATQAGATESREDRARWLADQQAWREYRLRNPTPVFAFEQLLSIFAEQRAIERFVEAFRITRELSAGWLDSLKRAAQETEVDNLYSDIVEIEEAYEELAAEYNRLAREANDRGAGLLGMVASLGVNIVVSAIPGAGPVLGSAVASGFYKAIDGGTFGEVLFAMGLAAGASTVAGEVSEAVLDGAQPTTGSTGPSQATINLAYAGGSVAAFPLSLAGSEFSRILSAAPSRSFSPRALAPAADTRAGPLVGHRTPDLDQVVESALRRLSAEVSGAEAAPGGATRPDPAVSTAQARRTRSLSERVWSARQSGAPQPVLSGDSLLVISAMQREIEKPVVARQVHQELIARAQRGLERMARETAAINLSDDRDRAVEAYQELLAAYQQLQEDISKRGGGLFGAICSLVGSVVGTMLGGPFLGAAFAGAIGTIAAGGHVGEALVMAGFTAGTTYAYSVAVPALRGALVGSPATDRGQVSRDELIDEELAGQIDSLYIEPVLERGGDDSFDPDAGAVRADAATDVSGNVPATLVADGVTTQAAPSDDSFKPGRGAVRVSGNVPATLVADGVTTQAAARARDPQVGLVHFDTRRNGFASRFTAVNNVVRGGLDAPRLLDGRGFAMNSYGNGSSTVWTGPGLGAPSSWVSLIPIVGPGVAALHDFGNGSYFWGSFHAALALSDAAVGTSAIRGLYYGGIKFGSQTRGAVSAWYRKTRGLDSGIEAHHWMIPVGGGGRFFPNWLKNQPWNLVPVPKVVHRVGIHGKGRHGGVLNFQEFWAGTPTWFKAGSFSWSGHSLLSIRAPERVPTARPVVENIPALSPERVMEGPPADPGR